MHIHFEDHPGGTGPHRTKKILYGSMSSMTGGIVCIPAHLLALAKQSKGASVVQHSCAAVSDTCTYALTAVWRLHCKLAEVNFISSNAT